MHAYVTSNVAEGFLPTCSGRRVHIANPLPDEIDIEDIAHGLSHTCRFAGHVPLYYSVAQHSLLVSELLDERTAMWGLLHDASEAYLHDLTRPLKRVMAATAESTDRLQTQPRTIWLTRASCGAKDGWWWRTRSLPPFCRIASTAE